MYLCFHDDMIEASWWFESFDNNHINVVVNSSGGAGEGTIADIITSWLLFLIQIYYFTPAPDKQSSTFRPIQQHKSSNQKYTGFGFVPCNGYLPCQVSIEKIIDEWVQYLTCKMEHFPPHYNANRKLGQEAEWNGKEG